MYSVHFILNGCTQVKGTLNCGMNISQIYVFKHIYIFFKLYHNIESKIMIMNQIYLFLNRAFELKPKQI